MSQLRVTIVCEQGTAVVALPAHASVAELLVLVADAFGTTPASVTLILGGEPLDSSHVVGTLPSLELLAIVSRATKCNKQLHPRLDALLPRLRADEILNDVDLRDLSLGDAGVQSLCEALEHSSFVTSFFLANNFIGDSGAKALAGVVGLCGFHILNVDNNLIGDEGFEALASALHTNSTLHHLSIASNSATRLGGLSLAKRWT